MKIITKWLSVLVVIVARVALFWICLGICTFTAQAVDYPSTTVNPLTVDLDFNGKKISNIGDVIAKGPWIDVRAYGAKGDGVTDDTAAIQAAIDAASAANGGLVVVPRGRFRVTSLTMKRFVRLEGISHRGPDSDQGSQIQGLNQTQDTITFDSSASFMSLSHLNISGGRHAVSRLAGTGAQAHLTIEDCTLAGALRAQLYFQGDLEETYVTNCRFSSGEYGFWFDSQPEVPGTNAWARSSFKNCLFGGHTINAIRINIVSRANGISFIDCSSAGIGREAIKLAGGSNFTFLNFNSETACLDVGNARYTTGTITQGSTALTVADATGYSNTDTVTIQGAGPDGTDFSSTVASVAPPIINLNNPVTLGVTNAWVTRSTIDIIGADNAGGQALGSNIVFIGCGLADNQTPSRYSVNMTTGSGIVTFINCEIGGPYQPSPIYDLYGYAHVIGGSCVYRTPASPKADSFRVSNFGNSNVPSQGFEPSIRTKIFSARGGDLLLGLRDSNDDGTGTYGVIEVRKRDADRTRVFYIDSAGAVAVPGTITIGSGTAIAKHLSATTTWDPPSISNGAATSTTLTVTGAVVGDTVAVGFSTAVPGKALLVGAVTAANTVTVTLANHTGGALNLASGTLRADVWRH